MDTRRFEPRGSGRTHRGARRDETHRARRKGRILRRGRVTRGRDGGGEGGGRAPRIGRVTLRAPHRNAATPSRRRATETSDARFVGGFIPGAPSASPSPAVRTSAAALLRFRARLRADARVGRVRVRATRGHRAAQRHRHPRRERTRGEPGERGKGGGEERKREREEDPEEEKEEDSGASPTETTKSTHANGASSSTTSMIVSYAAANAIVTDALEAVDEAEAASPAIVPATGVPSGVKSRHSSLKSPAPDPDAARARWGEHLRGLAGRRRRAPGPARLPEYKPARRRWALGSKPSRTGWRPGYRPGSPASPPGCPPSAPGWLRGFKTARERGCRGCRPSGTVWGTSPSARDGSRRRVRRV